MPTARKSHRRLATQATQLALAVPQVVGHRMARMALAGPAMTERDRREFRGMLDEKVLAFWQSWFGMGWAVLQSMQRTWIASLQGARVPLIDAQKVLAHGIAPIQRKASANAKRLARTRMR